MASGKWQAARVASGEPDPARRVDSLLAPRRLAPGGAGPAGRLTSGRTPIRLGGCAQQVTERRRNVGPLTCTTVAHKFASLARLGAPSAGLVAAPRRQPPPPPAGTLTHGAGAAGSACTCACQAGGPEVFGRRRVAGRAGRQRCQAGLGGAEPPSPRGGWPPGDPGSGRPAEARRDTEARLGSRHACDDKIGLPQFHLNGRLRAWRPLAFAALRRPLACRHRVRRAPGPASPFLT